jgi:hypothetical protein
MSYRSNHIRVGIDSGDVRGADNRAIQIAIDALPPEGGTVEVLPGEYICADSVHLRSCVHLVGAGDKTVLKRADGFRVAMEIDADYGQLKITPVDTTPFKVGQGLYVRDDKSGGFLDSVVTVRKIDNGAIHFDEALVIDYSEERGGEVVASGAVISGVDVVDVAVEGLVADGNKEGNFPLDGCQSGCIYFHRASRVAIADVDVKDFGGDGVSFQTTRDFHIERVRVSGCTNYGMHPGTGSTRVLMRDCRFTENLVGGFFLCWRVQESRFENITCERNAEWGLNIGHKDTDNVFVGCRFANNGRVGVLFRKENAKNGGHRNLFTRCVIEDNGAAGIDVVGQVHDIDFVSSVIRDTRGANGTQRVGIVLGEHARRFRSTDCTWEGHAEGNVRDLSGPEGSHKLDAPE